MSKHSNETRAKMSASALRRYERTPFDQRVRQRRFTPEQATSIRQRVTDGEKQEVLAAEFDVTQGAISTIVARRSYKEVP